MTDMNPSPNPLDSDDPRLTAYALGELDAEQAAEVAVRIAADPALAEQVESIRAGADLVGEALANEHLLQPAQAANAAASPRSTAGRIGPDRRPAWRSRPALLAAGLALAAGAAITAVSLLNTNDAADDTAQHDTAAPRDRPVGLVQVGQAMGDMVAVDFDNTPLSQVIAYLHKQTAVPIDVDWAALQARGVTPDTPVSLRADEPVPARDLLSAALRVAWGQSPHPDPADWSVTDAGVTVTAKSALVQERLAATAKLLADRRFSQAPIDPGLLRAGRARVWESDLWNRIGQKRAEAADAVVAEADSLLNAAQSAIDQQDYPQAAARASRAYLLLSANGRVLTPEQVGSQLKRIGELQSTVFAGLRRQDDALLAEAKARAEQAGTELDDYQSVLLAAGQAMDAGDFPAAYEALNTGAQALQAGRESMDAEVYRDRLSRAARLHMQVVRQHRRADLEQLAEQELERLASPDDTTAPPVREKLVEELERFKDQLAEADDYGVAIPQLNQALSIAPNNTAVRGIRDRMVTWEFNRGYDFDGDGYMDGRAGEMRVGRALISDGARLLDKNVDYLATMPDSGVTRYDLYSLNGSLNGRDLNPGKQVTTASPPRTPVPGQVTVDTALGLAMPGEQRSPVAEAYLELAQQEAEFGESLWFEQSSEANALPQLRELNRAFNVSEQQGQRRSQTTSYFSYAGEDLGRVSLGTTVGYVVDNRFGVPLEPALVSDLTSESRNASTTVALLPLHDAEGRPVTHRKMIESKLSLLTEGAEVSDLDVPTRAQYDALVAALQEAEATEPLELSRIEATRELAELEQQFIDGTRRAFEEDPMASRDAYALVNDNPFYAVIDPGREMSTFSVDVDTAAYTIVRRQLMQQQQLPIPGAVRIEELINYFDYGYDAPVVDGRALVDGVVTQQSLETYEKQHDGFAPFATHVELASCPWQAGHQLVRVGIKGMEVAQEDRPAAHLTFLLDVSGSMNSENKLPLVKESLKLLLDKLNAADRVSIVVYAGASGTIIEDVAANDRATIEDALDRLSAGGSTAGAAGIQLAYDIADKHFIDGGVNRVILCTDGDFNVGVSDTDDLVALIKDKANPQPDDDGKRRGVYLSVLGYGFGNLNDQMMEPLTNAGNGNYAYIDTLQEAAKVMYDQAGATLVTIAKDVKVQVHFDPSQVLAYRLIGYENRVLANEDFDNDQVDAGDIGAGHSVTALYEVVPFNFHDGGDPGEAVREVRRQIKQLEEAIVLNRSLLQTASLTQEQVLKLTGANRLLEQEHTLARAVVARLATKASSSSSSANRDGGAASNEAASGEAAGAVAEETFEDGAMLAVKLRYKPVDAPAEDGTSRLVSERVFAADAVAFDDAQESTRFAAAVAGFGMALRRSPHAGNADLGWVIDTARAAATHDPGRFKHQFITLAEKAQELMPDDPEPAEEAQPGDPDVPK